MSQIPNKSALLEQIARERTLWEQLLAEIGEARMLEPGATGDWTFKDVVAHLNGWRSKTLARLDAAQHGHAPAAPPWPAQLNEDDDVDQINDWIYQANLNRPLQAVLDEYHASFQRIHDSVMALSERDLAEPGRYSWLAGDALAEVVTASFGHFHEEHEPVLRAWLDQLEQADA
jgi:hypothetical protein